MSIYKAMWTGVSGLAAESQALGVVGDNVANSNTLGYKLSRAVFEDVLGGAVGQNIGGGVRMARAQQIFAQGTIMNTGQPTDLAITGDGFFCVKGTLDGLTGQFYTRAGDFTMDKDGYLVNPNGLKLQGYASDGNGGFAASPSDVQIPTAPLAPKPTSSVTVDANLDSRETPPTGVWDPQNPATTSNTSTSTTVYDSLGNPHSVQIYFTNTGPGTWEYHAIVDGGELAGGTPGQNTEIATGNLTFNTDGTLQDNQVTAGGTVDFAGATPGQPLAFDFGTPIAAGGSGMDGITQFAQASAVAYQSQDGYASGSITGVQVDGNGTVMGVYSNGQTLPISQLAIAKFTSNDGLGRAGHNSWIATRASGEPVLGPPGAGGRGGVVSGALEQSNVDIAGQFVELIAHQRAFQANSKTITTADEMLQEVVNLKR
ncbi:MAG: flagellar hook protein FlgE [Polyangiaceae bacterium]